MLQTDELLGAWRNSPVAKVPPSEVVLVTDFDGTLADIVPDPAQTVARPEALQALSRLGRLPAAVIVPGARLEVKPASSAIHFRNTNLSGEEMLALIQPLMNGRPLAAYLGRKVIEVHAPKAGKGSALASLLPGEDPGGVACFGDDEDAPSRFG